MSQVIEYRLPCTHCNSSDAYHIYDDGHGFCFSCKSFDPPPEMTYNEDDYTYQYINYRNILPETFKFFGIEAKVAPDGKPVAFGFPCPTGATKIRDLTVSKRNGFSVAGTDDQRRAPCLIGRDKFSPGSANAITVVEGDFDLPATYQMLGSKYPVVSVRSSATAKADCQADWEYLNSFNKIYLCFDNDKAGTEAKLEVAQLFDFNKVYDVKISLKDPDQYNQEHRQDEFKKIWFNSKRFLPEGVISSYSEFDSIIDTEGELPVATYPFRTLEEMTDGIRLGEVVLITAQEKIGKTEIIRAIEAHLFRTTDDNIGIIHLEESKQRCIQGLAGYDLQVPCHLSNSGVSKDDIKAALRRITIRDERLHLYSHFGSDDPDVILNTIRFLVSVCGCRYIFLDHITMVVTGLKDEDERKALDYLSTQLKMMAETLKFCLFLVSHVNDEGQTRGSRNISKVCDIRIHLDRDLLSSSPIVRNTTNLFIYANRWTGLTGPAGKLLFEPSTYIVRELTPADEVQPPERLDNDIREAVSEST